MAPRRPRPGIVLAIGLLVTVGACGGDSSALPESGPAGSPGAPGGAVDLPPVSGTLEPPPPVTLRYGTESIVLDAHMFCYGNGCADGPPPAEPPDIGSPGNLVIEFPLESWTFEATFMPLGGDCRAVLTLAAEPSAGGTWFLTPEPFFSGTYDVALSGRGNGDLSTLFRWSSPSGRSVPVGESSSSVLARPTAPAGWECLPDGSQKSLS